MPGFEQEAKGQVSLFSVSLCKTFGDRAKCHGLFSVEDSTINTLWYKGWKMFVMSWVCTSPSVEAPVSLQQGNVRSCSSILCFYHVKKQQTLRKLKTSPASRPELFHLCQMATKRMFRSLSPLTHVCKAILRVELCSRDGTVTIIFFMGFVLLCIHIVGFWLWFLKHWWFLFYSWSWS